MRRTYPTLEKETFCDFVVDTLETNVGTKMYDVEMMFDAYNTAAAASGAEQRSYKKWIDKKETRDLIATRGTKARGTRYFDIPEVIQRIATAPGTKRIYVNYGLMVLAAYFIDPRNIWKLDGCWSDCAVGGADAADEVVDDAQQAAEDGDDNDDE